MMIIQKEKKNLTNSKVSQKEYLILSIPFPYSKEREREKIFLCIRMNVLRPLSSVQTPKYDSDKNHRAYYVFLRAVNFYYVPNFSGE